MNRAFNFVRSQDRNRPGKPALRRVHEAAPTTVLPDEAAMVFGPLGVQALHASVVDVESMACEQRWHITPEGMQLAETSSPAARTPDGFSSAMATIVHLNRDDANGTLARQIDLHRWAFAWRVDDRHVAVAEAHYREACDSATSGDGALVRQICDTGIRIGRFIGAGEAVNDRSQPLLPAALAWMQRWPAVTAGLLRWRAMDASAARQPNTQATRPSMLRRRAGVWIAVIALAAAAMAGGHMVLNRMQAPVASDQALADATMSRLLDSTLATGDYGEVQSVLDSFAQLHYFSGAVVTNDRQLVVAQSGQTPILRIGEPVPEAALATGRRLRIGTGQLIVWGALTAR